jgi:hypothetical protein
MAEQRRDQEQNNRNNADDPHRLEGSVVLAALVAPPGLPDQANGNARESKGEKDPS